MRPARGDYPCKAISILVGQIENHERFEDLRLDGVPVINPHPGGRLDIRMHL